MTHWQDFVFAAGAVIKIVGLLPSLRSHMKPAPRTSAQYSFVGFAFCAAYVTLGLWLSFVTTLIHSIMWLWLGVQGHRQYGG